VANATGAAWSALAQIVCIPIYLKTMGAEAYGLVGFFVTLQMSLQIFDLGLSPTVNREMARLTAGGGQQDMARDLVRTVEVGYWLIGIAAAFVIFLSAEWISINWVRPTLLSQPTVRDSLAIMGCVVALQWPLSLYQGGLIGLQRQVLLNVIKVVAVTASTVGSIFILKFVSPTITAFFLWQVVVSALNVTAVVLALWLALPKGTRAPRFDFQLLRNVMPFAGGMAGIALCSLVLAQTDKVLLSKLLSLEDFGYYVLAGTIAGALQLCIAPIFTAVFPRLTALVAVGDSSGVRQLYHLGSQAMAFALAPLLIMLGGFSTEIVRIWTGNEAAAVYAGAVAPLLVAGTALNGVLHMPHALRLAHGWTRLDLAIGLVMLVVLVPAIVFSAQRFGGVGAATTWVLLNISALFITVPLTHRRLLPDDKRSWIFGDTLAPWAAAATAVWIVWFFLGDLLRTHSMVSIPLLGFLAVATAGLTLPDIRARILQVFARSSPAQI
jgi:O-antigen/teichoic acid export membrane protein